MNAALPKPGPPSVRITRDHYQWTVVWASCVEVLLDQEGADDNPLVAIGVEADSAGNLDNAVTYRRHPPHTYCQVKYAVDASIPVNRDYLTARSSTRGQSILRKLHETRHDLIGDAEGVHADLHLVAPSASAAPSLPPPGRIFNAISKRSRTISPVRRK